MIPRSVLITGGAGFIGSHLAEHLLARGDRVTIIDNLSTGRPSNLDVARRGPHAPNLELITGDCAAALADLQAQRRRFDEMYHLAAAVGVRLIVDQPIESIETNVLQTSAALRFAQHSGTGSTPCPILIASSSEVYGKSEKTPFSEDDDVLYGPTTKARWSYAASKAIDEYLALAYHQQRGVPVVVTRFFNTVGPRQVGDWGMVLPSFVRAALDRQPLRVFGDGAQSRCFCDVRDVVSALPTLLRTPDTRGQVFNIGSDRSISIRALAELVIKVTGSTSDIHTIRYDQAYASGFEDLRRREPDLRKIRQAIGFAQTISLEQTIADLAASMQ
jgi:UDP-glucose 4-epimerase